MKPWEVVWADTDTGALNVGERFRSLAEAMREAKRRKPGRVWHGFDKRILPDPMARAAGGRPIHRLLEFCGFYMGVRAALARAES